MAPANEALDKPFLRIRGVLVVSGLVIWPQGFHAKGHGSVPCGPVSLGSFPLPIPVCVCARKWDHGLTSTSSLPMLCVCLIHPHRWPPPGLYCFFIFLLLIKKVSVQNTFPTPLDLQVSHFLDFRFAWKSLKAKVLFSFCSHYVLPSPFVCVETTASLYAWCTLSYNLTSPRIKSYLSLSLQSTLHFVHNEGTRLLSKWNSFMSHPLSLCF